MASSLQVWQLVIALMVLIGGWLGSFNLIREKVIRLEEKVHSLQDNHGRLDKGIRDVKMVLDKIWERMEKKADK